MSQILSHPTITSMGGIVTLTGNTGGPVGPDGAGNIDVLGENGYQVAGTPLSFELTVSGTTATTTTLDDTPTILWNYTLSPSSAITINATVVLAQSDYTGSGGGSLVGTARREAAGGAILVDSIPSDGEDFSGGDPVFEFTVSGNDAQIVVIGLPATGINWKVQLTYVVLP